MTLHATDIVAYTYRAETLCPSCVMAAEQANAQTFQASTHTDAELFLAEAAEHLGVDRMDERSFDSDEFPKVVFASQIEECGACAACQEAGEDVTGCGYNRCDACGEALI